MSANLVLFGKKMEASLWGKKCKSVLYFSPFLNVPFNLDNFNTFLHKNKQATSTGLDIVCFVFK